MNGHSSTDGRSRAFLYPHDWIQLLLLYGPLPVHLMTFMTSTYAVYILYIHVVIITTITTLYKMYIIYVHHIHIIILGLGTNYSILLTINDGTHTDKQKKMKSWRGNEEVSLENFSLGTWRILLSVAR